MKINSSISFKRNFDFGTNNITNGLDTSLSSKQTDDLQDIFKMNVSEKSAKKIESRPLNLREKQRYVFQIVIFMNMELYHVFNNSFIFQSF